MLIEAKNSELKPDSSLLYFYERLKPQFAFQVVLEKEILKQVRPSVFVIDIFHFLKLLV
jgi:hypothetical protein